MRHHLHCRTIQIQQHDERLYKTMKLTLTLQEVQVEYTCQVFVEILTRPRTSGTVNGFRRVQVCVTAKGNKECREHRARTSLF